MYNRNVDYIRDFIVKYSIEYSFEDLMSMSTIYINFDEWAFRVYANLIEQKTDINLNEDQKRNVKIREDFIKFVYYYDQLKLIKQLEIIENNLANAKRLADDPTIRSLKFSEA